MKKCMVVLFLVFVGCVSSKPFIESKASFGTVTGRVLFMNGEPVLSQTVNLFELIERNEKDPFYPYLKMKFEISAAAVTDSNGRFMFEHVRPGMYSVTVNGIKDGMFKVPVGESRRVLGGKVTDYGDISMMME
ncbi:MAG: hypothetical protein MRK01_04150 [Candidatus Scalindua sp.]|nr:hypothetical protein [Candidatus Scalindua sp.]